MSTDVRYKAASDINQRLLIGTTLPSGERTSDGVNCYLLPLIWF